MKRTLLLINLLLLPVESNIYAKSITVRSKHIKNVKEQMKLGLQVGAGRIPHKASIFGECKCNEALGVQLNVVYSLDIYFLSLPEVREGKSAFAQTNSISIPIILRAYPGKDRQFCWFGGVQLGYLIAGRFRFKTEEKLDFEKSLMGTINDFGNSPDISLKEMDKQNKLQKFQLGLVAGFDYEFEFGLILGLSYTKPFIDAIQSKESYGNWSLQPTLGYNFGKLL